jgi:hypothetical protein
MYLSWEGGRGGGGGGQTNYSFHVRKRHGGEESESSRGWEPKWRGFCFGFFKWWSCFYFGINYQISYPVDPDVFVWTPIDRNLHLSRPVAMAIDKSQESPVWIWVSRAAWKFHMASFSQKLLLFSYSHETCIRIQSHFRISFYILISIQLWYFII